MAYAIRANAVKTIQPEKKWTYEKMEMYSMRVYPRRRKPAGILPQMQATGKQVC